jgi:hypothetical protein
MAASGSFATPRANSGSFATNEECRKLLSTTENKVIGLVLKVTPVQLADALDQLYDDATNRLILLPRAVGIISMQLIGSSDEEVKRMLAFERAMAAGSVPPPR